MSEQLIKTPGLFGENDNFLLERELGSGGMGGVYMGRDKMLDRPVAVKVMLKEYGNDPEFVEKFKREAQSVARLIHPNIAQVYSYGICDGMPYIAMELACGGSLYSIMQATPGKTDVPRVIKICQQVAQALQCANDQGCVHGDVKPENILLDANGNAKLVDFGLAAMQKDTDEIWGTPYYISPEKVRKEPVDFRADMYSLGGTLYHALTGVAPFEGEDSIAVVKKRFAGPPKKPSEIRADLTPAIDDLVMRMLALNKEDRFPSFESLLEAFKEVLTTGLTKDTATTSGSTVKRAVTTTGRRTMIVRGRRTTFAKRPGAAPTTLSPENREEGDAAGLDATAPSANEENDEDEKGGNLLVKVLLFAFGGLLLIAGIGGGLWWYVVSDKAAKAAEVQRQIDQGYAKARSAVTDTVTRAVKFADELDAFAQRAVDACEQPTRELANLLAPEHAKLLKIQPTKELLDAIAATNDAPPKAEAPVAASAAPATTNAPAATAAKDAKKTDAKKKDAKPDATKPSEELPAAVATMHELWTRAYGCQASAIRIRHAVRQLVKKSAEGGDALTEKTEENARALGKLSVALSEQFEQIKGSKDAENIRKGITYIKTRGEKLVDQTQKRLRIAKLEATRKAQAEAAAAAEKERQEKLAAERQAKVDEEIKSVTEKFETIVSQGTLRQLDWRNALRQLETLKSDLKTPEGLHLADIQIRKVNDMKKMQEVFIKSLGGYVFRNKTKIKGAKVISANEREINMERSKTKMRLPWHKFYKEPSHLNEVINHFIIRGRDHARPKLNLKDWADAMTGAVLTLQLFYEDNESAIKTGEKLARQTVEEFPEYAKTAKEIFPEITFDTTAE